MKFAVIASIFLTTSISLAETHSGEAEELLSVENIVLSCNGESDIPETF